MRRPPTRNETSATGRLDDRWAALRVASYRFLWVGGLFSFLSVQMQFIARGQLAYDLTGTNKGLGGVYLGFGIAMLVGMPWGGVLADRVAKKGLLLAAQGALVVSSFVIAGAISLDALRYWMLVLASVVQGLSFSVVGPTRVAFAGELVGRELLGNAIVLTQMSMNGTRVFGPALAGAFLGVAVIGPGGVYYLTGAIMLITVACTLPLPAGRPRADRPRRSPAAELVDGVRYVAGRPRLALLTVTCFFVVMLSFPYVAFLPSLNQSVFGMPEWGYGLMSSATAVGAVVASVYVANRAAGPRAVRLQVVAALGFGGAVALLAGAPTFVAALPVLVVVGASASGYQSLNNSLALELSDSAYHGRLQSLLMLSFSGFGLAALPLGAVADAIGLRTTLALMGLSTIAVVAWFVVRWRRLDRVAAALGAGAARLPTGAGREA